MFRYLITFLLLVGHGSGFTVWFNNIKLADSTAVPVLDNAGIPIEGGVGYVAAGTFPTPPEQVANFDEFEVFGDGTSSFNGIAAGFFDLGRSAPIPSGTTNAPVGERIYVVIGDGDTLSTSTDFALFDSGLTFGTENTLGLGASDISITSENLSSDSLIVGDILTDVDTGLGLTFEKAIRLATTRVTLAPILSADLKGFYPSEEGETLTIDATPVEGFPATFTYQWYYNGDAYPISEGGGNATRTFAGNSVDNGTWTIVVSNTAGSASHTFDHRVYLPESSPPVLEVGGFYETAINQPVNIDATPIVGYPVDFTFQWYFGGNAIGADQGGRNRIFNLLGSGNENGKWSVVVTNAAGSTEQVFEYRVFSDSDGDGLSDYREQNILGTNFELADTDSDGLSDSDEVSGSTDPSVADTDGDGLLDGDELNITDTDPIVGDSDSDGVGDGEEDNDNDGLTNAQEIGIYLTDPLLADSDSDGLSDSTEIRLNLDPKIVTNMEDVANELSALRVSYENVLAERDARFVDTDADGITDVKEAELESDSAEVTVFYLQDVYEAAMINSRIVGRSDVTGAPSAYDLTPTAIYDAVVAERDARFVDTDADGITDVKEAELESDSAEATVFYLQDVYEAAMINSRIVGRSDVTGAPSAYDLTPTAIYDAVVAERDARFVDTDADGITDVKEAELESDSAEATVFYLQDVYEAAVINSRIVGRSDVTGAPSAYDLTPTAIYDAVVAERDARFVDTDADGITDVKEAELESDSAEATVFYLQDVYEAAVINSRIVGRSDVTGAPSAYDLTPTAIYDAVVAERDARFVDTDADGITDVKEAELESDSAEATVFYLQDVYEAAVINSRIVGRSDVTGAPSAYDLTPTAIYDAVVAERDARFVDTDADGITDVKEAELESDSAEATVFYLQDVYEAAVINSRIVGRSDVTGAPSAYDLTPTAIYDAVVAERDARFVDTDADGITDVKEAELETDVTEKTTFYLQSVYNSAITDARESALTEVLSNLQKYSLKTEEAYNLVVSQRDARFEDTDRDGITNAKENELETDPNDGTVFYLENTGFEDAVAASRQTGRNDVVVFPFRYGLVALEEYNKVVAERDERFSDSDGDGLTDLKETELDTNSEQETSFYLQSVFETAVLTAQEEGRNAVTNNPANYDLTSQTLYNAVVAQRDARPTQEAYQDVVEQRDERFVDTDADGITDIKEAELSSDSQEVTIFYLEGVYQDSVLNARITGRGDVTRNPLDYELTTISSYNTAIEQRDARPTQVAYSSMVAQRDSRPTREEYNLVVQERDARLTLGEVKDARLGSVVLQPDRANNSVKIRFSIEETDDFRNWTSPGGINELIMPLEAGKKFYRFALEGE